MVAGLSLMTSLSFVESGDVQGLKAFLANDNVEVDEVCNSFYNTYNNNKLSTY